MSSVELVDSLEGLESFLVLHHAQLTASGIPEIYWATLHDKLAHSKFDAGESFGVAEINDDETLIKSAFNKWTVLVTCPVGICATDPQHIYLIDHAWTFRPEQVKSHLLNIPGLLARMCTLMGVSYDKNIESEAVIKEVMTSMWKYSQSYSIGNKDLEAEERLPIWYIMDEFGQLYVSNCGVNIPSILPSLPFPIVFLSTGAVRFLFTFTRLPPKMNSLKSL